MKYIIGPDLICNSNSAQETEFHLQFYCGHRAKWACILFTRSIIRIFVPRMPNRSSGLPSRPTFRPLARSRSFARAYLSTCLPAWPHPTWPDPVACDFGFVILTSTILKDPFPGGVASWHSRCHARAVCITLHRRRRYGNVSVRRIAKFNCHGNLYRCCIDDNRRGNIYHL